MHKILYTSDIHGNVVQYRKLIDYAMEKVADFIIIGGDLAPKNFSSSDFIAGQRDFFKNKMPDILSPFKERLPKSKILLMMGNDDCAANMDILDLFDNDLIHLIHNKRKKLTDGLDLVGYSYVPITPFGIKDWEKYDFSRVPQNMDANYAIRKMGNYRLDGKKSTRDVWKDFIFTSEMEKEESIQKDLMSEIFTLRPDKTIYVMHCPPDNSNLDMTSPLSTSGANHVGSMAIRSFIEEYQPFLTLHGHIHETVEMSGQFKHEIGTTPCLASGNHNEGEDLAVLVFNVENVRGVQRKVI
jgi:uncharacterized protein